MYTAEKLADPHQMQSHTSATHPLHQKNSLGLDHTQGLPLGLSLVADQGPHLASSASTSARKYMLHGL
jgi:hypothetical protein